LGIPCFNKYFPIDAIGGEVKILISTDEQLGIISPTEPEEKASIVYLCIVTVETKCIFAEDKRIVIVELGYIVDSAFPTDHMNCGLVFIEHPALFRLQVNIISLECPILCKSIGGKLSL
jgi:hypothetical protein